MRTLIVIPARLAATRLRNKPLRDLGGRPLVVRVMERVRQAAPDTDCVVATDSNEVANAVTAAGGQAVMTSSSCQSGTERVADVAAQKDFGGYDVFVNVQGDEPFIGAESISGSARQVEQHGFDIGTAASRAPLSVLGDPNVVKVVLGDKNRALYFSRAPVPFLRDETDESELHDTVLQHVGIYAYTRTSLAKWMSLPPHPLEQIERLEQLRTLAAGMTIVVSVTDERPSLGIDTEDDLVRANASWQRENENATAGASS